MLSPCFQALNDQNLDRQREACQVILRHLLQGNFMSLPTNEKRLNITITGDDVDLIKELQVKLNKKLMMQLSLAQVVKRLVRQASINEIA